ncbi:MAG: methylamine utilization protein [Thermomonas sp.]
MEPMHIPAWTLTALRVTALFLAFSGSAVAGTITVTVTGQGGPLENAVVAMYAAHAPPATRLPSRDMDQRGMTFQPHVLAVQAGSEVGFPNSDNTRHQVYSFSPAKTFELPLYSGTKAKPIQLGTPGVVELGCNIHDWMLGYIVVLDTPYFAVTSANGQATIEVPSGSYRLEAWHESQDAPPGQRTSQQVTVTANKSSTQIDMRVKSPPPSKQPANDRLRDLQQRFRAVKRER